MTALLIFLAACGIAIGLLEVGHRAEQAAHDEADFRAHVDTALAVVNVPVGLRVVS